jgi:hypothetical protein
MASAPFDSPAPTRPRSVTLIAAGVLLLGLANIYRAAVLYQQTELQLDLGVSVDPRIRLIIALIWSAVMIALSISLMIRKPWSRILVPLLLLLYGIYRVVLIALFAGSEYAQDSQIPTILFYGVVVAFCSWALSRKPAQAYFESAVDRQEDERDKHS